MKLIRPNVPAGNSSGGYIGSPQTPQWRKEWIEEKKRWAHLSCGCITDIIHDRTLLIIDAFPDTQIYCETHRKFVVVKKQTATKNRPTVIPDEPLF